jgi:hypothetical protein
MFFDGHGEGESAIESEDDGRGWEGGWRQSWSYTSIGEVPFTSACILFSVTTMGAFQPSPNRVLVESV